jgi:hypothetical protein
LGAGFGLGVGGVPIYLVEDAVKEFTAALAVGTPKAIPGLQVEMPETVA